MSSTPTEVLDLATRLLDDSNGIIPDEVTLRCSTSRAYYAALHAVDDALPESLSPSTSERKGKSSHQAIIDAAVRWAKRPGDGRIEAISLARNLPKLRNARKNADYKMVVDYTLQEAKEALRVAQLTVAGAIRAAERAALKVAQESAG